MSPSKRPPKAISPTRDLLQSRLLLLTLLPLLAGCVVQSAVEPTLPALYLNLSFIVSLVFAVLAWRLRAATPAAAACGGVICFLLTNASTSGSNVFRSCLLPLIALFVLTFAATRLGRSRKEIHGIAEARTGRRASQVVANLGFAALCAAMSRAHPVAFPAAIAALGEATADTLSSEVGQAFGGSPFLLTTFRRVATGTDGAVTLTGTLSGLAGAAAVIWAGLIACSPNPILFPAIFAAAAAGLFFDSFLGAAIERRGYIGNDLVNFTSTAFSAVITCLLLHAIGSGTHF